MKAYLDLLTAIKERGTLKPAAREGMPSTTSLFGYQFRHNLQDGFPLLTTKKMFWKGVVIELIWFLKGDTNIKFLVDNGVKIWNEDAYNYYKKKCEKHSFDPMDYDEFVARIKSGSKDGQHLMLMHQFAGLYELGDCGAQYGEVWRRFGGVDQMAQVILALKKAPASRRHIVSAWNPAQLDNVALHWCHALFQFNCRPMTDVERCLYATGVVGLVLDEVALKNSNVPKYYLDCQLYQRSADVFLGVPFNIASYALLTHIIAHECNMVAGEFIHTFGDVHIYENHTEQVDEQLTREPKPLPKLIIDTSTHVWSWEKPNLNTIRLCEYDPHPKIAAKLSTGLK